VGTAVQQVAVALLTFGFGLLAVCVARRAPPESAGRPGLGWRITGTYFLLIGAFSFVQSVVSVFAVRAGEASEIYAFAVRWGAPANVARSLATIAFAALLLYAQTGGRERARSASRASLPLLLCLVVVATYAADRPGLAVFHLHASALAVLGAVISVFLLAALLLALARDGMDEVLWLALTAYAMKEVLSVSLFSIMAWVHGAAGGGTVRLFYSISFWVMLGMCLAAAWRLRQAAAGRRVPSLLDRVRTVRPPVMGWDRVG
jgi:hypothetical protein